MRLVQQGVVCPIVMNNRLTLTGIEIMMKVEEIKFIPCG